MTGRGEDRPDIVAALEALRARGAPRSEPVRFRRIEAMARRAAGHDGAARRGLDARLLALVAECEAALERARREAEAAPAPGPQPVPAPLSGLLAHVTRHGGDAGERREAGAAPVELKALREHRSTWARLSLDRRLTQSRSQVPANAGPLNTERLLHQALTTLRDTSPEYLQRLMGQIEALLWLEQAGAAPARAETPADARPRPCAGRTPRHAAAGARRGRGSG